MNIIIVLLLIVRIEATIRLGRISNTSWKFNAITTSDQYMMVTTRTCEQCVCLMLTMDGLSTTLSCQPATMTCQILFRNASAQLVTDESSMTYLLNVSDIDLIMNKQESENTTSSPTCSPTCLNGGECIATNTCQCLSTIWTGSYCQTPIQILWQFDYTFNDTTGNFIGMGINAPTFNSPGIDGSGTCLYLNASANQSMTVISPSFFNMANVSFTVSAWFMAKSLRNGSSSRNSDNGIFGQHDQSNPSRSLHLILRQRRAFMGFYSNDLPGNQLISPQIWYHIAFVYDYPAQQQSIYINGVLDATLTPRSPYQGSTGYLTIGTTGVYTGANYWDGCLDRISLVSRVKSADEIRLEATLTVYYPFDSTLLDHGPLNINATGINFQYAAAGRINRCLDLSANPSFINISGLIYLGTDNYPYSISIWVQPRVVTSGTIVHVSSQTNHVIWSMPMLGFTRDGRVVVQSCSSNNSISLTGLSILVGIWTHLAVTYEPSNGTRLWINGTQFGPSSSKYNFLSAGVPVIATIGYGSNSTGPCLSNIINSGQYSGLIDEFRLFSRALSESDVWNLANP